MASPALAVPRASATVHEVEVLDRRPVSPSAQLLRVARPPGFDFPATQVAQLWLGGEKRTMTIASGPARPHLEFVTLITPSRFKQAFAALRPGDRVGLAGPHGRFLLEPARPAVMLAGHIGIAPFKAMLEHAADGGLALEGGLLHAHPPGDAPLREELGELAGAAGLRLEEAPPGGLGDAQRVAALAAGLAEPVFYVAGSARELAEAAAALALLGVPRERLKVELFTGYR